MAVKTLHPTEGARSAVVDCDASRTYCLAEGVQVRQEKFGLLFYNYRGPRLYFVPSGDLIADRFFEGMQTVSDIVERVHRQQGWPRQWIQDKVSEIVRMLEGKGLIHGKPLC